MLPELLDQIPPEQQIASVTADGAFDTRRCHDAIAARGAAAIFPARITSAACKSLGVNSRHLACVVVALPWRTGPIVFPSIPAKGSHHQTLGSNT